jgi:hypothetical protein
VSTVQGRTLDWRPRFDPESLNYKIADHFGLTKAPVTKTWRRYQWLDQGPDGACTGFGLSHVLGCNPRRIRTGITYDFAMKRYHRAQDEDQWPGNAYEGSSVLGATMAAKKDGLIEAVYWATTIEEIIHGVGLKGPMEIGVNWYDGMFEPDAQGLLRPTGKLAGGHAPCIGGVNVAQERFKIYNSWGRSWARDGSADILFSDMDRLLHEDGEFALPIKLSTSKTLLQKLTPCLTR